MAQKVVYKAHPREAPQALSELRQAGLSPVALDPVDPYQRFSPRGARMVRIAVPRSQAKDARAVLRRWRRKGEPVAEAAEREFAGQALKAGIPAGAVTALTALAALALGQNDGVLIMVESVGAGVLAGVVALVVIARR
jgi:hypothetical protein